MLRFNVQDGWVANNDQVCIFKNISGGQTYSLLHEFDLELGVVDVPQGLTDFLQHGLCGIESTTELCSIGNSISMTTSVQSNGTW